MNNNAANLLLLNNTASRRRFHTTNVSIRRGSLMVPLDDKNDDEKIQENRRFVLKLKSWATASKRQSRTATGKGIARLVEIIAEDGRVSVEDENLILETIAVQRGWWSTLVVMDTLVIALASAMLCFEELKDNGHWSEDAKLYLLFAYHTSLSLLLYGTLCHLIMVLLLSGLSTYVFEVKGIITFFVRCHSLLVHVNFSGMLFILPGCFCVPVLAQVYSYGILQAIPSMVCCFSNIMVVIYLYARVIKPVFTGLYNEEYSIDATIKDSSKLPTVTGTMSPESQEA